jgi:molybdopterin-guanine dinucleotide biosynthesis protein A
MAAWVADAIRPHVSSLVVVGDALAAQALQAVAISDGALAGQGPLAGIGAALSWARAENAAWLLTAPCDTPLLQAGAAAALFAAMERDAAVAFARTADGDQPLVAVWRADLHPYIEELLRAGRHPPLHSLLAEVGAAPVWFENGDDFFNANTPEQLALASAALAARNSAKL